MNLSDKILNRLTNISIGGLMLLFLFLVHTSAAQQLGGINKILLIGQVTNQVNGAPIKNQQIIITSDSTYNPDFIYHALVYTDIEGYFYDSIFTNVNKGGFVISTLDYMNNYHDTTVYFRFNWSEENVLFPNFILPVEPPQIYYQANFYYHKNPSGLNPSEYQFFDISNVTNIIKREWNFGDGTTSTEINPIHKFNSTGLYRVTFTITIQPTPNSIPVYSSIVKIINVSVKNYFFLGGHVMAGYFPIDHGEAFLYKIDNKELVLIDTAIFNDTLGFYLFYQLIEGDYIVKANLCSNSVHFNHFMTTYYSNKAVWTEADTINLSENGCEYNITLIPVSQNYNGEGKISGTISYGSDPDNEKNVPAVNVEILLLDENNNPVRCCYSNEDGLFCFDNVAPGSYRIHPEITGKYTYPVDVVIDESNLKIENIHLTIGAYTVHGNVNEIRESIWSDNISQPYPNPAGEFLYLDFKYSDEKPVILSTYNTNGQLVNSLEIIKIDQNIPVRLNLQGLPHGIYFIKISSDNRETLRKFIKL